VEQRRSSEARTRSGGPATQSRREELMVDDVVLLAGQRCACGAARHTRGAEASAVQRAAGGERGELMSYLEGFIFAKYCRQRAGQPIDSKNILIVAGMYCVHRSANVIYVNSSRKVLSFYIRRVRTKSWT
jgi:hypothetical protein